MNLDNQVWVQTKKHLYSFKFPISIILLIAVYNFTLIVFGKISSLYVYITPDIAPTHQLLIFPFLVFSCLLVSIQWCRWLYAMIRGKYERDLFVGKYFFPYLKGSYCFWFLVNPAYSFMLLTLSGETLSNAIFVVLLVVFCGLPIFLVFAMLTGMFDFSPIEHSKDNYILQISISVVIFMALLDILFNFTDALEDFAACSFINGHAYILMLGSAFFFKASDMICRPLIPQKYIPNHYMFLLPTLLISLALLYIDFLSSKFRPVCYLLQ